MVAALSRVPREQARGYLLGLIAETQLTDPLATVTIVVPTAAAAIRLPRLLLEEQDRGPGHGVRRGLVGVNFVTLARLANVLGASVFALEGRRPLTRTILAATVRDALAGRSGAFGAATTHPATAAEVTDRYEELRFAGALGAGSPPLQLSSRAGELLTLCRSVRERVVMTTYDDVDLFEEATNALRDASPDLLGSVVCYLPERARRAEVEFLVAVAKQGPLRILLAEVGSEDGDAAAVELERQFASAFDISAAPARGTGSVGGPDQLLLAPNPRAEARSAVRIVLERLEAGVDPEQIALLFAARDPYLRLLVAELESSGVPFVAPSPDPLAAFPPGRALLALVDLATGTVRRDALMTLLRSAPISLGSRQVPLAEWDRVTRRLGIVEGTTLEWRARLADLVRREDTDGRPDEGGADTLRPHSLRSRDAAFGLGAFIDLLDELLDAGRRARGWSELSTWARRALGALVGAAQDSSLLTTIRSAREATEAILVELGSLGELEPGVSIGDLAARLAEELRRPGPRLGRLGLGVTVGPLDQLLGIDVELAVVIGSSAANLPSGAGRSPLLEAVDREELGLDPLSARAALLRATRQLGLLRRSSAVLVATAPILDSSGRQVIVSRLVDGPALVQAIPGEVASLAAVLRDSPARNIAELETALLFATPPFLAARQAARHSLGGLAERLEIVGARERGEFGRSSGSIGARIAGIDASPYSPTSLEEIAVCPFRHFLRHVLSCEALDEPERRIEIDPRNRGNIVHEALERYVREVIVDPTLGGSDRAARLREIASAVIARYERFGLTGKRVVFELERRKIFEGLEATRRMDESIYSATGERPVAVEHAFGFDPVPPVRIETAGRTLTFRGKIDRIDVASDGSIVVIDYKTGRPGSFSSIEVDPIDGGRHLQLPIYALAARAHLDSGDAKVRAAFRFVGPAPSEIAVALDASVEARLGEALDVLSEVVERGAFLMRPGESAYGGYDNCRFCDFDSVCPPDRHRYAAAAASSGLLDRYISLTDGGVDDEQGARSLQVTRA